MEIKYLVMSGGGPVGFLEYGILKHLSKMNIIKHSNIKSIYATSIGTLIALIFSLQFDWDWMDDFLVKRPWHNLVNITSNDYLNLFNLKGLLNISAIVDAIKPLLLAKDIDINITLKELYELTNIDLHLFTVNLNKFCKIDLNYKSHPDLKLIEAMYMSMSVPILFQPIFYNNEYYLDGGMLVNCPLNECFYTEKCNADEILALINDKRHPLDTSNNFYIENNYFTDNDNSDTITKDTNLLNFLLYIFKASFKKIMLLENETTIDIKNIINICLTEYSTDIKYWNYVFHNLPERQRLLEMGVELSKKFIENNKKILDISNISIDNKILDISNISIDNKILDIGDVLVE